MTAERRKFTKKFKLEVVRAYLHRAPHETQADIGKRYQLGKSAMSNWIGLYGSQVSRTLQGQVTPPSPPGRRPTPLVPSHALDVLASVTSAIETLAPRERRSVVEAVLGLLPP
jgi:transposase-like protein